MRQQSDKTQLSASQEDYLEAIFQVQREKTTVRAKDIAARLEVTGASVTGALHALSEKALIHYAPYGSVTLTSRGRRVAADIVRRHQALRDFFVRVLGVDEETAQVSACRMEHALSDVLLDRLVAYVEDVTT
mgnify:CR=1 FL=1